MIYNKLIKELEISANKLMRSERETAWREIARQVAHEIKDPLTPMKLNIQFLQMAWDERNPDIDRKLRETTKSILEQIDILSNIATAFSDYAKLPKKNIETFNLDVVVIVVKVYRIDNHFFQIECLYVFLRQFCVIRKCRRNIGKYVNLFENGFCRLS